MKELVENVLVPTWYQSIGNSEEPSVHSQCDTSQVNTQATTTGWYVTPQNKKSPASEEPPAAPLPTIETSPLSSIPAGSGWDDNTSAANGNTAVEETVAAWTPQDQTELSVSAGTAAAHDKGVDTQHVSAAATQASTPAPIRRSSSRKRSKGNAHASTSTHKSTRGSNDELQVAGDNHTVHPHASSSGTSAATLDESDIPNSAWGLHSRPHLRVLAAARYLDIFPQQSLVLQDEPMVANAAHAEALEILYLGGQDNVNAAERILKAFNKQKEWEKETGYAGH